MYTYFVVQEVVNKLSTGCYVQVAFCPGNVVRKRRLFVDFRPLVRLISDGVSITDSFFIQPGDMNSRESTRICSTVGSNRVPMNVFSIVYCHWRYPRYMEPVSVACVPVPADHWYHVAIVVRLQDLNQLPVGSQREFLPRQVDEVFPLFVFP